MFTYQCEKCGALQSFKLPLPMYVNCEVCGDGLIKPFKGNPKETPDNKVMIQILEFSNKQRVILIKGNSKEYAHYKTSGMSDYQRMDVSQLFKPFNNVKTVEGRLY